MSTRKYILCTLFGLIGSTFAYGQDLIHHVPENAEFVTVINNKAIVKHSSFDKINEVLHKLGAFDALNSEREMPIKSIMDLALSYDRNAYVYKTSNDSLYYVGVLLPLKEGVNVDEELFATFKRLPSIDGYERRQAENGRTQVAWNQNTLFLLTGDFHYHYFEDGEVSRRYGIEVDSVDAAAIPSIWDDADATEAADSAVYDIATVPDTLVGVEVEEMIDAAADTAWMEVATDSIVDGEDTEWTAYDFEQAADTAAVDTAYLEAPMAMDTYYTDSYEVDGYSDSLYQEQAARQAKNDSLRNQAFVNWLASDFTNYLQPTASIRKHKEILQYDKNNTLVHMWVKDLDEVYRNAIPYDVLNMSVGFNMKNLDYGYEDAVFDLIQDKHTLKLTGSIGLDNDVQRILGTIYKNKMNRKFSKYIPENHLGYLAVNINTEAYLKSLPALFDRWYAPLVYNYADLLHIAGTALEIAIDERAISNVMQGDHVVFINDLKKVTTEYTDYEYDEDYNYKEVKKTKEEHIPNFLWMFTSKDQRLFEMILAYAEKKEKATQDQGIYTFQEKEKDMPLHILFKDDMVFVSNDREQLSDIGANRFKGSTNAYVKKQLYSNTMSAVVHASEIPKTMEKLEIPVVDDWRKFVEELSQYGDITLKANSRNTKRITGEIAIEFPKKGNNAMQYLLQYLSDYVTP